VVENLVVASGWPIPNNIEGIAGREHVAATFSQRMLAEEMGLQHVSIPCWPRKWVYNLSQYSAGRGCLATTFLRDCWPKLLATTCFQEIAGNMFQRMLAAGRGNGSTTCLNTVLAEEMDLQPVSIHCWPRMLGHNMFKGLLAKIAGHNLFPRD